MFLTDLADKLRGYRGADGTRLNVIETSGWRTRTYDGNGMAGNIGVLWHHTATGNASYRNSSTPTLNLVTNGRSDLPGPLCNILFGRNGEVVIVAAGQANHAGRGSVFGSYANMGNYYLIGIEMESDGISNDWTDAQKRIAPHLGAALDLAYSGGGDYYQIGHKEYSSEGKIDPAFWDMDGFRGQINTLLSGGSLGNAAPEPERNVSAGSAPRVQPFWTVEKGDTLSKIARYYKGQASKHTVKDIADYNGIGVDSVLKVGQTVKIPAPLVWVVEQGEVDRGLTWKEIADYYGFDEGYLRSLNPGKSLTAGTVVTVW